MKVYLGIDWSEQKHDVCVLNSAGAVIEQYIIAHNLDGMEELLERIGKLQLPPEAIAIGLETAHNLVIDVLLDRGYACIYVLPPSQVKANAGRFAQSGASDDPRAARLIADILRTDQGTLRAWKCDNRLTRQLQLQTRVIIQLNRNIRRFTNQLRALLLRYYPNALQIFDKLESPTSLALIETYPTPQAAQSVSFKDFCQFLTDHHCYQRQRWLTYYEHLTAPQLHAHPDTVAVCAPHAQRLLALLKPFVAERPKALAQFNQLFDQHPDAHLFASLPGVGDFLAPALLAKLGDDRQRFPSLNVLQAIAGTCPITKRSGKHKSVRFRRACDREFRYILFQWAKQAILHSPWAASYYRQLLNRGVPKSAATRRVSQRLLSILWKIWQSRTEYDEAFHLQQRIARARPLLSR